MFHVENFALAALNTFGQFMQLRSDFGEGHAGVDGLEAMELLQLGVEVLVHDGHLLLQSEIKCVVSKVST